MVFRFYFLIYKYSQTSLIRSHWSLDNFGRINQESLYKTETQPHPTPSTIGYTYTPPPYKGSLSQFIKGWLYPVLEANILNIITL